LTTLDLVEFYLCKLQIKGKEGKYWKQGKDWYRYTFTFDCISCAHMNRTTTDVDLVVPYFFCCFASWFRPACEIIKWNQLCVVSLYIFFWSQLCRFVD
jgi:hypothetical protein